jgi:hypothetical protein
MAGVKPRERSGFLIFLENLFLYLYQMVQNGLNECLIILLENR